MGPPAAQAWSHAEFFALCKHATRVALRARTTAPPNQTETLHPAAHWPGGYHAASRLRGNAKRNEAPSVGAGHAVPGTSRRSCHLSQKPPKKFHRHHENAQSAARPAPEATWPRVVAHAAAGRVAGTCGCLKSQGHKGTPVPEEQRGTRMRQKAARGRLSVIVVRSRKPKAARGRGVNSQSTVPRRL